MGINVVEFTVQFDRHAWESISAEDRQRWVDDVADAINAHAYVSNIRANG